ncbi:Beta-amylase [Heracleum sosnowskyi]|uniref:Beta-amylase n=1 Tax=Heracleum sosnowskyi TaxID=360622 RepID=A0AAD8ITE5_9APIA|nr:Beta-amylase [Heracleum sosnowskyi]
MESVSMIGNSQANLGSLNSDIIRFSSFKRCFNSSKKLQIDFGGRVKLVNIPHKLSLRISATKQPVPVPSEKFSGRNSVNSKPKDGVKLYVGLPLDSVSDCNTVNYAKAISVGLKALKLLGVEGVELPIWWGVAEGEAMGKYEWSGYLALAEMVQKLGLKLHVSLCFHSSKESKIPLPKWVSKIGEAEPSIFFTDRSGHRYKECLSLAVDELPVLNGNTPTQVYKEFFESFKASFSPFLGSTITGISIGLGPDGELRYPSYDQQSKNSNIRGAGEFQCYDKNMISNLKPQAEALGNPLWGLSGPHDAPSYDDSPLLNNFFKDQWGSWETAYGDFFLYWYSSQLITHGYYNTDKRNGYEEVVQMFLRNSSKIILPGMDLSDDYQQNQTHSSPESLVEQIKTTSRKCGVEISGQNLMVSGPPEGFEQIKKNLRGDHAVDLFTYQRMGSEFFSPDHFPSFTAFIRSLNQQEWLLDDLPMNEEESPSRKNLQTQTA